MLSERNEVGSLIFNTQVEYNKFYNKLRHYANWQASKLFYDTGLREDAVDKAMNEFTDAYLKGIKTDNLEYSAMRIVKNTLRQDARWAKVKPVSLKGTGYDEWGWRGRQIVDKRERNPTK